MRQFALFIAAIVFATARAQDCVPTWMQGTGVSGVIGAVNAMVEWDPDGAGPLPKVLVVGGSFTQASTTTAYSIATWDGHEFRSLGSTRFEGPVYALAVYQGTLYVGGSALLRHPDTSSSCLVAWNGSDWTSIVAGNGQTVYALTEYQGDLVLGGFFNTIAGKQYGNIARWNETLQQFGFGFTNTVRTLCVYRGELIASGTFTRSGTTNISRIARWNGISWSPLDTGITGTVRAMAVFNDELVVGGYQIVAGGLAETAIVRWDGHAWSALNDVPVTPVQDVYALKARENLLLAGATLRIGAAPATSGLVTWNGSDWTQIPGEIQTGTMCFTQYQDQLYVGGAFNLAARVPVANLVRWDGVHWRSLGEGTGSPRYVLAARQTVFALVGSICMAQWDKDCWRSMPPPPATIQVESYFSHQDDLYLTARFAGETGYRVLKFNGTTYDTLGEMFDDRIVFTVDLNGHLVVSGRFTHVGGTDCRAVAQWNGTSWQPVGDGLWTWPQVSSEITALASYRGDLFVFGNFNRSGDTVIKDAARWDGTSWQQIPKIPGGPGFLRVYRDELLSLGGPVLSWNGQAWISRGGSISGYILSAALFQGRLIASGWALSPENVPLAEWTGSDWKPFGAPLLHDLGGNFEVTSLAPREDVLFVSGRFSAAGTEATNALARLRACPICPTDLNGDSLIDDADFSDFILSYNLMDCTDPAMPAACPADFNADGLVDDTDFTRFVIDYAAFLCPEAD
jgi:hypothetical protein